MFRMNLNFSNCVLILTMPLFLFIAENALTDLVFSSVFKNISALILAFLLLLLYANNINYFNKLHHAIYLLSIILCVFSLLSRYIFVPDENIENTLKTFLKFFTFIIFIIAIDIRVKYLNYNDNKIRLPSILIYFLLIIIVSFVAYIIFPISYYTFIDHSGHVIELVYGSFSSSIYVIGASHFARLSFIFDEPGTFGMFMSFLISVFYYFERKISGFQKLMIIAGIASMSLSFFLFLSILIFMDNFKYLIYQAKLKSFISFTLLISFIILFVINHESNDILKYIYERFFSIFTNSNNRSVGNSAALQAILNNPFGVSVSDFEIRRFSSSGIFVITAYHGIFYCLSFIISLASFFWSISSKGNVFPLLIAVTISVITRNNMFNFSGVSLLLLSFLIFQTSIILGRNKAT